MFSRVGFKTYGNAGLVRSIFKLSESIEDVCFGGIIILKGGTFNNDEDEDDEDEDDDDDEDEDLGSLSDFKANLSFSDLVGEEEVREPSDFKVNPQRWSSVDGGQEWSSHLVGI